MVRVSGNALWFEHDERGDVDREPAVDTSIELRVGQGIEASVGQIEQGDFRDAQERGGVDQLASADLCQSLVGTDRAGFAMGEAQDANLTPLARQTREECT